MDAVGFVDELCRMTQAGELDWTVRGAGYEAVNGKGRSVLVQSGSVVLTDGGRRRVFSADTRELEVAIEVWELERNYG